MSETQVKIALRNCGYIDPGNIDHYIDRDGYKGLFRALNMQPENVIDEIKRSGIKTSGYGIPVGINWEKYRNISDPDKYLVCDAYESSPDHPIFKTLLEGDPHSVLEGMLIGAYAVRASRGLVYINPGSGSAIKILNNALGQMEKYLFRDNNIPDSKFNFHLTIKEIDHYAIFDEEQAKISSRNNNNESFSMSPFPTTAGVNNQPTIVHTAETWANVSAVLQMGPENFAAYGTAKSKGTKIISLNGAIKNKGVFEVPFGISIKSIIEDLGGGICEGAEIKTIQIGGHLGGYLPADGIDTPLDHDDLISAGCIAGTGSVSILDKNTCIVDFTKNIISYTQAASCGECVLCREGTAQILQILKDIADGGAKIDDMELLLELSEGLKFGSQCSFGKNAANIVATGLKYFKDEYKSHISEKKCPVNVCKTGSR